ncbi:glycosyltransferase family 4 protein [Conexibacter sp. DBS9H8]|uniref:glycosyltransferase family 4 protein n=1 Tax=Conexibacter sp. DBS9H8 TaxID=2937801 RepID=UPI00200E8563|nr:glycosyltransferase family 4 protein [Conexibacter sp. DBS9H8]
MRVDLLDPPAYLPSYDHELARALARTGVSVRLLTGPFVYGPVPAPDGYDRKVVFYRRAVSGAHPRRRRVHKLAAHLPGLVSYRRHAAGDLCHVQWLTLPALDLALLPRRPLVLTLHDPFTRGRPDQWIPAAALRRVGAIIVHSGFAREQLLLRVPGLAPGRVHVVPIGMSAAPAPGAPGPAAVDAPGAPAPRSAGAPAPTETEAASGAPELPPELVPSGRPVVLLYGLIRPYKGLEALLAAWRQVHGADLWVVGRPMYDIAEEIAGAPAGVQFVPRYVDGLEERALLQAADVLVVPYLPAGQFSSSAVLATAMAAAKPVVASALGSFTELIAAGGVRGVPPADPAALAAGLQELIDDPGARAALGARAAALATGPFSWAAAAEATVDVYRTVLG